MGSLLEGHFDLESGLALPNLALVPFQYHLISFQYHLVFFQYHLYVKFDSLIDEKRSEYEKKLKEELGTLPSYADSNLDTDSD